MPSLNPSLSTLEPNQEGEETTSEDNLLHGVYYCTKFITFPTFLVIDAINKKCSNIDTIQLKDLYNHLREVFAVNSFNRSNLIRLLESTGFRYDGINVIKKADYKNKLKTTHIDDFAILFTHIHKTWSVIGREFLLIFARFGLKETQSILHQLIGSSHLELSPIDESKEEILIQSFFIFTQFFDDQLLDRISQDSRLFEMTKLRFLKEMRKVQSFSNHFNRLQSVFSKMTPINRDLKIKFIVSPDLGILCDYHGYETVGQFIDEFNEDMLIEFYPYITEISSLFDVLKPDYKEIIQQFTQQALGKHDSVRNIDMLIMRSQGFTLETIGSKHSLTRERIRQIIGRIHIQFNKLFNLPNSLLNGILLGSLPQLAYIKKSDLASIWGPSWEIIFSYMLGYEKVHYYENYDFCNFSDISWIEDIQALIDYKKMEYSKEEMVNLIQNAFNRFKDILGPNGKSLCESIITSSFNQINETYFNKKIYRSDKYFIVMDRYFKEGMRIANPLELQKFRIYYYQIFDDSSIFDKESRAIVARLSDISQIVDRGTYSTTPPTTALPNELIMEIDTFIKNQGPIIPFKTIFHVFESTLKTYQVNNHYYLQNLLRKQLPPGYYFSRDYLSKKIGGQNFFNELDSYFRWLRRPFSFNDVQQKFPGIENHLLGFFFSKYPKYISNLGFWTHPDLIHFENTTKEEIKEGIINLFKTKKTLSAKNIFDFILEKFPIWAEDNKINNSFYAFSIIRSFYDGDFHFQRPYLSLHGAPIVTSEEQVQSFIYEHPRLSITDIKDFAEENNFTIMDYLSLINSISEDYLRIDMENFVHKGELPLSTTQIELIDLLVAQLKGESKEFLLSSIVSYRFFPFFEFPWNHYLLASIIKIYLPNWVITQTTNNYRTNDYLLT